MKFQEHARVSLPAERVFELVAERVEDLVPFLPNVASIRTQAQERRDAFRTKTRRIWQALPGTLPRAFRPFLRPEMMRWTDISLWDSSDFSETWHLETPTGAKLYTCTGFNAFRPHTDNPEAETMMSFSGELTLHPEHVRGVPRVIGRRLVPQVEAFIVSVIQRNFMEVVTALRRHEELQLQASRL